MEEFHRIAVCHLTSSSRSIREAAARNAGADIIDLGMGNPDPRRRPM
jgi:hypothetical protein